MATKTFGAEGNATDEVVIPLDKSKIGLVLLGAVAFVAAGIGIWFFADRQERFNPLFMKAVAVAAVSFFGLFAIYASVKIFDNRPGLILDAHGIVDSSSGAAVGRIDWEDVTGLKVSTIADQRFVTIEVADPQKYVEGLGAFKRMLNGANANMTGSPINISSNSLSLTFDELLNVLTDAIEKQKLTTEKDDLY